MKNKFSKFINLQGKYLTSLLFVLLLGIGQMWGADGDVLFSQNFNSATAVDYTANTARTYTSSNYSSLCGTTATSQFTTITCVAKTNAGIGINSSTGGNGENWTGKFGSYANNTSYYWSICKTSNFAATAPTAIKIEMNAAFSYVSSGSNTGVQVAVGSGFSSGLTNSCPALTNCVAGFSLPSNSSIKISKYVTSNGVTNLSSSTLTNGTSYKYTWIINNTASSLSYTDPKGNTSSVASGCWDLWVGNTLYCDDVTKATTGMSGTSLNNLYIGSSFGKKHEFVIDDIKVIDLTPAAATTHTLTWNFAGGSTSSTTHTAAGQVAEGATITYPADNTMSKEGYDFTGWSTSVTTMPTSDLTITAQWEEHTTASTNANLSTLSVAGCELNETFAAATTAYTIDLPFYASMPAVADVTATKEDANASDPVVSISGNVITVEVTPESGAGDKKTYTITVNIAAAPAASSSLNLEQNVLDHGTSWGVSAALAAANIIVDGTNGLDSLNDDPSKSARNYPYLGLKFKKKDADIIKIVVPANNVLNVKFGNVGIALTTTVNGAAGANVAKASSGTFHLDAAANVREVVFRSSAAQTVTLQQVKIGAEFDAITLPWKVTYTVGSNGTCAKASEVWTGTALTLPSVTANQGYTFDGWSDGTTTYTAGASYTPTTNVELTAQYSMDEDDRLASLEFNNVAVAGFSPDNGVYYMTVPYSVALPQITAAVPVDAVNTTATIQETYWDDVNKYYVAQVYTTTASDAHKFYQVRFTMEPKKGVEIIKVVVPAGTHNDTEATGYFGGTGDSKNEGNSLKIGSNCYAGVVLPVGKTFQEGDVINIHTSVVSTSGGSVIKIYADKEAETLLYNTETIGGTTAGDNIFVLPAAVNNQSSLYVVRTGDNSWNGSIDYISVERCMASFIESFEIENVDLTIEGTAITATVPSAFDVTALTPTIKAWANGGATVTPTGAQDFTDPVDYTVSSIYGEQTVYTVTITKVVPSAEPVITSQPQGANYLEGASIAALEVEATGEALTYQWYLGANAIDGATAATYTPTVSAIGSYVYHCVVTNTEAGHPATSLASSNATITITEDPSCKAIGYGTSRALAANTEVVIDATTGLKQISSVEALETGKKISGETNLSVVKLGGSSAFYDIYTTEKNIGSIALSLTSSSNGADKRYKYAVIFCKTAEFDATKILGVVEQTCGAGDDEQVINTPEVPLGTKLVRVMRQYTYGETNYGQGNSSYIYYVRACLVEPAQEVIASVTAEPASANYCPSDAVAELNYTLSIEEGASAAYQWYKGNDAIDGATDAAYLPAETGVYTCKASLTKTGRLPKQLTSAEATVNFYAATEITAHVDAVGQVDAEKAISVTAEGTNVTYKWQACDANGIVTDETVLGTAATLNVVVAAETKYYLATVTGTCGVKMQVVKAQVWAPVEQADVTGSRTWNWNKNQNPNAWTGITDDIEITSTSVLANVNNGIIPNNADFRSDMLKAVVGGVQTKIRKGTDNGCFQGNEIMFHTTVPGLVSVTYRGTGNNAKVTLTIGSETLDEYNGAFTTSKKVLVPAGDVTISCAETMRIQKIEFDADPDHYRENLNPSNLGTLCWKNNAVLWGATLYEFTGKNENNYLVFDEVVDNRIEAGKPYIFMPENGNTEIKVFNIDNEPAKTESDLQPVNHMYGTIQGKTLTQADNADMYYFSSNHIWRVGDFNVNIEVPAYYCYVDYKAVLADEPAPAAAPGRRRVTMGVQGEQVATGMEQITNDQLPMTNKVLINGQLFILRGEKMFNANGQLVK